MIRALRWCVLGILLVVTACGNSRSVDDAHRVNEKYVSVELVETVTSRTVKCAEGGVALGAGYRIHSVGLPSRDAVSVRANRPAGATSWLFTFARNSDAPPGAVSVSLHLYCMRRTDGSPIELSAQAIAGQDLVWVPSPTSVPTAGGNAACPAGQTLTGGGFEVRLVAQPSDSLYNSWITVSRPESDRRSWRVEAAFIDNGDPLPRVRPYANCASDPDGVLRPVSADDVDAALHSNLGFDFYEGTASCGKAAFAPAGGFTIRVNNLIPHRILATEAASQLSGWHGLGVYGAESGDASSLTIRPLCFEALEIVTPMRVDLVALLGDDPLNSTGCPNGAPFCFTFTVTNAGTAASQATEAEITIPGIDSAREIVPPLAASESVELTVGLGAGACDQNCSVRATVDPDNTILESYESNNTVTWFEVG